MKKIHIFILTFFCFSHIQAAADKDVINNLREERTLLKKELKKISIQLRKNKFTPEILACKSSIVNKILNNLQKEPKKNEYIKNQIKEFERIKAEFDNTQISHSSLDAITESRICEYKVEYLERKQTEQIKELQKQRKLLRIARAKLNEKRKHKKEFEQQNKNQKTDISTKEKEKIEETIFGKPLKDTCFGVDQNKQEIDGSEEPLYLDVLFEMPEDTLNLVTLYKSQYIPKNTNLSHKDNSQTKKQEQNNRTLFSKFYTFFTSLKPW